MKDKILKLFRVKPGSKFNLAERDTGWEFNEEIKGFGRKEAKAYAEQYLLDTRKELADAQELLYADNVHSILIVVQALDAAGKDGLIEHVMSGVNPQGCQVHSFKAPSSEELDHNYLWRFMKALPERGRIGIFNRSYYEDVLVVKVHPELLVKAKWPPGQPPKNLWQERYEDINAFEKHLVRNGTVVLKFFLNVSRKEQKDRLLARLDTPEKNWKFNINDLVERGYWKDYQQAYQDAIRATSTEWAPWYVLPADHKWATRALAAGIITQAIKDLKLKYPQPTAEELKQIAKAKKMLAGK